MIEIDVAKQVMVKEGERESISSIAIAIALCCNQSLNVHVHAFVYAAVSLSQQSACITSVADFFLSVFLFSFRKRTHANYQMFTDVILIVMVLHLVGLCVVVALESVDCTMARAIIWFDVTVDSAAAAAAAFVHSDML